MTLKIFHTGDLHLGKKFTSYRDDVMEDLSEARYESLEYMIKKSNELDTDIFVIAGDLFNTIKLSKKDIKRTVKILEKYNGACVLVLPGNHDYDDGRIDLWMEFKQFIEEKVLLINEEKIYDLKDYGLDVWIYPAPCHSKHSENNSLSWMKELSIEDESKHHIGVAHGALEGLSADMEGKYYYMEMDELLDIPMDLWLLGHTHVRYPLKEEVNDHRIYNAGSHEPDGLHFKGEASAWYIELSNKSVLAQAIYTGKYRFYDKSISLKQDRDLEELVKKFALKDDPKRKLVRLKLSGSISKEAYESLSEFYSKLESELFYLEIEDDKLSRKINKEIIEEEFTKGSLPYEFLKKLVDDEEALQIAYELIRRD